ncbi:HET domain-containing protein, partial [Paraphoma chrysanthemicola]
MHLLNTSSLKLKTFLTTIPPYAILSHTWDEDEVSFDDINKPHAATLRGYEKIKLSCTQAVLDGYEWIWIDTCCIDKKSSAELSEAINSMYMWYWDAEICYAYLSDVPGRKFVEARWFTRGWTLQELLAPTVVEFYTRDPVWRRIGTKLSLACEIECATEIQKTYLLDRRTIQQACVGEKFSWASKRITTRSEDIAYCLLGLVGVNMPLLYGEGAKAFHRLQLEIIKENTDHTIFAWEEPSIFWGMLAPTPLWFIIQHNEKLHRIDSLPRDLPFEMTNLGLRITLPSIELDGRVVLALLSCRTSKKARVGIHLTHIRDDIYARVPHSHIFFNSS